MNIAELLLRVKEKKAAASEVDPLSRKGIALDLVSAFRGKSMVSTEVLGEMMESQATMYLKANEQVTDSPGSERVRRA